MNEILQRIETITRSKGYNMKQMCSEINFTYRAWAGYKNRDTNPTIDFIKAFCTRFKVSADEVLFGNDAPVNDIDSPHQLQILARHLEDIPEEQRDRIYNHFVDTIDIYLSKK